MVMLVLMYGSESWFPLHSDMSKNQMVEIHSPRKVKGSTRLDRKHNDNFHMEINVYEVNYRSKQGACKWSGCGKITTGNKVIQT